MHDLTYLRELMIILAVAIVIVVAFYRLKLPAIAGFIFSGVLVGPGGFGLIDDPHQVEVLAEIGVALLLFGIGSELELAKLRRLWRPALIGGVLQVGLTTLAAFGIARLFGQDDPAAWVIGFIVALSSTAIVLRGLQQRGETDAPHGRLILGILVFQDLSVVPIMLTIPLLSQPDMSSGAFALTLGKSLGIVAAVLLLAVLVVPRTLKLVARTRQRQLFVLTVFVLCLGTAWLVTKSGASLAIGAFLAGLVVAGSEYRHQALADMIPFREVFSSLFFVSVGMILSPATIAANLTPILLVMGAILVGKAAIVALAAAATRLPARACLIAGLALAQVGEFSFVLVYAVQGSGLIDPLVENSLVSAAIFSMFLTPFAMSFGPRLAAGLGRFRRFKSFLPVETAEEASEQVCRLCDHVIVAGYGFAGRELAQTLRELSIPYVIVDINIENVERAAREGHKAVFGDVTSEDVLHQLGIESAREMVLLINHPSAAEHAVRVARGLVPQLHIVVRTTYLLDIKALQAAGADKVIPAEREAAAKVVTDVLPRHDIDSAKVAQIAEGIREHSENGNGDGA